MNHYKLNRYEKNKDHTGKIVSIFVAISCHDEISNESVTQEKWLNQEEQEAVLLDETALKPILNTMCAEGCIRLEQQIATKPQPTEYGDLSLFEINDEDVNLAINDLPNPLTEIIPDITPEV